MVTFELDGTIAQTAKVCENTELFRLAVSLGAVESLIEQPATMSHASYAARTVFVSESPMGSFAYPLDSNRWRILRWI